MDTIQIANILVTRRCNLACNYCNLIRDYPGMPLIYKRMNHYKHSELFAQNWIDIIEHLRLNNPNMFFIIYGGEPFVYEDLWRIIKHCNENKVMYTVISNNTDAVQDRIKYTYAMAGKFRGFTSSVDPVLFRDELEKDTSITKKSDSGFRRLWDMKLSGMADDVVAEITVTNSTVPYLYKTVKALSDRGIYSSITTLDDAKTEYYDFARVLDKSELVQKDERILEQFQMIKNDKDLLIHIPELLDDIYNMLPSNGNCNLHNNITNVTVDADGRFRLCLRIRGVCTPAVQQEGSWLDKVIDEYGQIQPYFKGAIAQDKKEYCKGCNWTCLVMSEKYCNGIINHE